MQSAKTAALGPRRDLEALPTILADPMLSRFQSEAAQAEETGWFWKYKVNSVEVCLLLFVSLLVTICLQASQADQIGNMHVAQKFAVQV